MLENLYYLFIHSMYKFFYKLYVLVKFLLINQI